MATVVLKQPTMNVMQNKYSRHAAVLADGSTNQKCSSSVIIPADSVSHECWVSHGTSLTSAELYGVLLFLSDVAHTGQRDSVVYSDSNAAFQRTEKMGICGSLDAVFTDIPQAIKRLEAGGHGAFLQWAPGHCSIHGNEKADRTAAVAYQSRATVPIIILSKRDRRSFLPTTVNPGTPAAVSGCPGPRHHVCSAL